MCQHDFLGRRIFQHRNLEKWDLFFNKRIKGFLMEEECHGYISDLRRAWDGRIHPQPEGKALADPRRKKQTIRIAATMISCQERDQLRRRTLKNLAKTDWGDLPLHIQFDTPGGGNSHQRQVQASYLALKKSLGFRADYILFLEDDLDFNRHLRHNLCHWSPIRRGAVTLASLYNPQFRDTAWDVRSNTRVVDANAAFGSQAFLLSKETVEYVVRRWDDAAGLQDIRIFRLAGRLGSPIFYHAPSLVQHIGVSSTWGGGFHQAFDFDPVWKA